MNDPDSKNQTYTSFLNRTEKKLMYSQVSQPEGNDTFKPTNKSLKTDYLGKKLSLLERKMEEFVIEDGKRQNNLKETIYKIKNTIQDRFDLQKETISQRTTLLVDSYSNSEKLLSGELKNQKSLETKILNKIDDRFLSLKRDVNIFANERETDLESLQKALEVDLPNLDDKLMTESRNTEDLLESLRERFSGELKSYTETLQGDIKGSEEHDAAVFDMLEEINLKSKDQIQAERHERKVCENNMFDLLETTCNKLNTVV